ncbi:hypothetical protein EDB85DRAFT_1622177 [Lactarius pseudohatsudake]|nr:hypothetical protein EDB85DRAFT_1622177 [Lactarius pseudohatsudake]
MERIAKEEKCDIYSFGINGESPFEAGLLERAPGCEVWGYDFTMDSFGPEIEKIPNLKKRAYRRCWAVVTFMAPRIRRNTIPQNGLRTAASSAAHQVVEQVNFAIVVPRIQPDLQRLMRRLGCGQRVKFGTLNFVLEHIDECVA